MANANIPALPEGFEEVSLPEGFEEVPLEAPVAPMEQQQQRAAQSSNAQFIPDEGQPSALEAGARVGRDQALFGFGDEAEALMEHFIARVELPNEQYDELYKGKFSENVAQAKERTELGRATSPSAEFAGEVLGAGASMASGELAAKPVTAVASKVLKPILGASKSALNKVGGLLTRYADELSAGAAQLEETEAKKLGVEGLRKMGQLLRDRGVTNTPRGVGHLLQATERGTEAKGQQLATLYKQLTKEVKASGIELRKSNVFSAVLKNTEGRIASKSVGAQQDIMTQVHKQVLAKLEKYSDDFVFTPEELWKVAKDIEKESGKWLTSTDPRLLSKGDAMQRVASGVRNMLEDLASGAEGIVSPKLSEDILRVGQEWKLLNAARQGVDKRARAGFRGKGVISSAGRMLNTQAVRGGVTLAAEGAQAAVNTAAKVLGFGERLGGYYKVLSSVVPKGLQAVATRHSYLMMNDPKYRDLISGLRDEPPEAFDGTDE